MSKLDELIQELCPNLPAGRQVEWVKLEDVCEFRNGFAFKSNLFKEIGCPILRITNIADGYIDLSDVKYFDNKDYKEDLEKYEVVKNDILVAMSGATTGKIGFYSNDNKAYLNQRVGKFLPNKEKLCNRFLYHFLLSKVDYIYQLAGGGAQPNLSSVKMMQTQIPLPPLAVQEEIVRILDNFTELTAEITEELTKEFTARKKQYEYYRDSLLTFGDDVELVKLEDVCCIGDGLHGTPKYASDGNYMFINGNNLSKGHIIVNEKTKKIDEDEYNRIRIVFDETIFMSINGTIGSIALYNGEKIALGKSVAYFNVNTEILYKRYLYFYLQSSISKMYFESNLTGSTIKNLGLKTLRDFKIPIPPLPEQQRIVNILDKFDTLTNSITEGLPKEIEQRKKQYEYYRDKLLSF